MLRDATNIRIRNMKMFTPQSIGDIFTKNNSQQTACGNEYKQASKNKNLIKSTRRIDFLFISVEID